MNQEFAQRQAQVLELLGIVSTSAEANHKTLVFIGGSAVQVILKQPQRLSIDLDIFYDGVPDDLVTSIPKEYVVTKKKSRDQDLFEFYETMKNNALVKLDISRFALVKNDHPYAKKEILIHGKKQSVLIATPDYLLASKFSSLAIGTIGRKSDRSDFQINFLKDVFDSNCLINDFGLTNKTLEYFNHIVAIQNTLRKTNYNINESLESAITALLNSCKKETNTSISKGALQSFNQYLLARKSIKQPEYWELAYRLAAYLQCFKKTNPLIEITALETKASHYANKQIIEQCEKQLVEKGIPEKEAHELKILSPKALIYLDEAKK